MLPPFFPEFWLACGFRRVEDLGIYVHPEGLAEPTACEKRGPVPILQYDLLGQRQLPGL